MVAKGNHPRLAVPHLGKSRIPPHIRMFSRVHRETVSFGLFRWSLAAAVDDDWYRHHPVIPQVAPRRRIPLGMHGDDAGVQGQGQVTTLTWGSLVAKLPTLDSRIIFTMAGLSM